MALEKSDLEAIGSFLREEVSSVEQRLLSTLESRIGEAVSAQAPAEPQTPEAAASDRASVVGVPDVPPDAGPEYYVHLADGEVVVSHDSSSTHLPNEAGDPVQVIGRYQKGA